VLRLPPLTFRYDGRMWGGRVVFAMVVAAGCTKANPAKHCDDGTCIDPNYPFCDVSGAIAGEPGACIATACTANELVECRGDVELRCNADGSNYNLTPCDRGCDAAANGCRLCDPGETACTNGQVATCDATGAVMASEPCPLGCFANEPRCREIEPSNGLAAYFDMVPNPPDLEINDAALSTVTGTLNDVSGTVVVPSFLVPATSTSPAIRVLIVNSLRAQKLVVNTSPNDYSPGPALAVLARGSIEVTGLLKLAPTVGDFDIAGCTGGNGIYNHSCVDIVAGAGGGANATNGAKGGDVASYTGGTAGIASGTTSITPLRGGCSGGGTDGPEGIYGGGGAGGGAVQLVSRSRVQIDGIVEVRGGDGEIERYAQESGYFETGGGAGGAILIEAPIVVLEVNAQLLAAGGSGSGLCSSATSYCGLAGAGAHAGAAAQAGQGASCDGVHFASAGAGGGGLGRVRINTTDGTYTKASSAIEDAAMSIGTITTR
jgi:hypothetical protein